MRLLRAALITLLLLAAIVALVPEDPVSVETDGSGKTLAAGEILAR